MEVGHGGPFGALVVYNNQIISEGWNQVTSTKDPTAHAEIVAIRSAAYDLSRFSLEGCTLYTSCEPCPMCLAAAYWARVDRLVYAATREDAAAIGFDDDAIYRELTLPISKRSLPMQQLLRAEAVQVFDAWRDKSDKVPY
jgi:tRNA(Arg) A34 adenosine deaminase TadA